MKKWIRILGSLLVLAISIVAVVFYLTQGMVKKTDEFFGLIHDNKIEEAYQSTAQPFQSSTSLQSFKELVSSLRLDQFEKSSWSSRSIEGSICKLEGTLHLSSGSDIPVKLQLIKENNEWKIYQMNIESGGLVHSS